MSNNDKTITPGEVTINIGHGNILLSRRIVAILESGSLPMKRLRERAGQDNKLIDATAGRKTRSLIVTDTTHVVLSALSPQVLKDRLNGTALVSRSQLEWMEGELVS